MDLDACLGVCFHDIYCERPRTFGSESGNYIYLLYRHLHTVGLLVVLSSFFMIDAFLRLLQIITVTCLVWIEAGALSASSRLCLQEPVRLH